MAATPSGKDKILRWTRIYCDEFNLSGDARTYSSLDCSFGEVDMTGWDESVKNYLSDDVLMIGIKGFQALLNDAAGRAFDVLKDRGIGQLSLQMGGGGEPAIGDPAYLMRGVQMSEQAAFDASKAVLTADFLPDAGQYDADAWFPFGVVLHPATSLTATTNGTSVDMGAAVADGIHALMHIIASSGGTWAFKLQHSTNDSDWVDVTGGGFTLDGSVVGSEAIEVAGAINRYVRFVATRTSGTVTPVVSLAWNLAL